MSLRGHDEWKTTEPVCQPGFECAECGGESRCGDCCPAWAQRETAALEVLIAMAHSGTEKREALEGLEEAALEHGNLLVRRWAQLELLRVRGLFLLTPERLAHFRGAIRLAEAGLEMPLTPLKREVMQGVIDAIAIEIREAQRACPCAFCREEEIK